MILRLRWRWFGPTILPEGGGGSGRTARSMLEILEDKPSKEKAGMSRLWTKKRKMRKIISAWKKKTIRLLRQTRTNIWGTGRALGVPREHDYTLFMAESASARAFPYFSYDIDVLWLNEKRSGWFAAQTLTFVRPQNPRNMWWAPARTLNWKADEQINVGLTYLFFREGRFGPTHLFFSIVTDKWGEREYWTERLVNRKSNGFEP